MHKLLNFQDKICRYLKNKCFIKKKTLCNYAKYKTTVNYLNIFFSTSFQKYHVTKVIFIYNWMIGVFLMDEINQ